MTCCDTSSRSESSNECLARRTIWPSVYRRQLSQVFGPREILCQTFLSPGSSRKPPPTDISFHSREKTYPKNTVFADLRPRLIFTSAEAIEPGPFDCSGKSREGRASQKVTEKLRTSADSQSTSAQGRSFLVQSTIIFENPCPHFSSRA